MNRAAQELARLGHAKRREPILNRARMIRAEIGLAPLPALAPELILSERLR